MKNVPLQDELALRVANLALACWAALPSADLSAGAAGGFAGAGEPDPDVAGVGEGEGRAGVGVGDGAGAGAASPPPPPEIGGAFGFCVRSTSCAPSGTGPLV